MTPSHISRACLLGVLLASGSAAAQPSLPLLFADGAVLQRDEAMPVWGWATPGAAITVSFDGKQATAKTDAQGRWKVRLPAHTAGGPYVLSVHGDGGALQVRDVLVGDVWLASGQSNMEWPLAQASDGPQAVAAANDTQLRHFKVPKSWSVQPEAKLTGGDWKAATPENAGAFSAVGYFFAKEVRASTGVPIGIVDSTWGGSAIEAWMDAASLGLKAEQNQGAIEAIKQRDAAAQAATGKRIGRWPKVEGDIPQWRTPEFDDRDWDSIPVTQQWELSGYEGMDGIAWYRTTFTLTAAEAKAGVQLGLARSTIRISPTSMASRWARPRNSGTCRACMQCRRRRCGPASTRSRCAWKTSVAVAACTARTNSASCKSAAPSAPWRAGNSARRRCACRSPTTRTSSPRCSTTR